MKDRLPSKYSAATRRIDIVCGKYSADAWGSSVAMTAHGAKASSSTELTDVGSPPVCGPPLCRSGIFVADMIESFELWRLTG
jgi:hypothetical protein